MADSAEIKLKRYKDSIQKAKSDISRLEGTRDSLLKRLKDEFGISDPTTVEKRLALLEAEVQDLDKKIQAKVSFIDSNYEL